MKISESHVSTSKVSFLNLDSRIRGFVDKWDLKTNNGKVRDEEAG